MARPDTSLTVMNNQTANWDAIFDGNMSRLEDRLFNEPYPIPLVHRTISAENSQPLSGFSASNYTYCVALCVDPATVATNGRLIYSDGSNWKYQKSNNNVV